MYFITEENQKLNWNILPKQIIHFTYYQSKEQLTLCLKTSTAQSEKKEPQAEGKRTPYRDREDAIDEFEIVSTYQLK